MAVRVGIVGLGVGKTHVELFQDTEGAEVAALCDVSEALLAEQAGKHGVAGISTP